MPKWFQNQMMRAFLEKDRYQVKMLNQCWFFYVRKERLNL
ncbi:cortex morphogenetic protein CmpA [Bacillus sp. V5-8f]|nr:cortex morphogenetic protein CmpA [Bacillus sp. V5-8f]PLT33552.1 cortex morphogenetic protein CmpA [Bacillus sp. V5-8f]